MILTASGYAIHLDGRTNPDGQTAPAGHIHFQIGNGGFTQANANAAVPLNQWVHVAAARKANEPARIYYNGVLQPSGVVTWNGNITYTGAEMDIGKQAGFGNRYFNGAIDDVQIYNRALTESEIKAFITQILPDKTTIFNAGTNWTVIASPATVGEGDTTYDNQNIRIAGTTLTVNGAHAFRERGVAERSCYDTQWHNHHIRDETRCDRLDAFLSTAQVR